MARFPTPVYRGRRLKIAREQSGGCSSPKWGSERQVQIQAPKAGTGMAREPPGKHRGVENWFTLTQADSLNPLGHF
ncbi:hypothetical protein VNPA141709_59660 [Pseudomonas aeruginosa]|nr:hypothetical protein VNPA141709_59660 [Pseudomonas aeruginosa]